MATSALTPGVTELRSIAVGADRRTVGRTAGIVMTVSAPLAAATAQLSRPSGTTPAFFAICVLSALVGVACYLIRWDELPARCLHAIPLVATVLVACGVRLAGEYGNVAADYYVFISVFAAFAFDSRRAVAAHTTIAAAASALPLLYAGVHRHSLAVPRTITGILMLVVITSIVTLLREALQLRRRQFEELALHDPLTGVGNYRLLSERLSYELKRHRRSGQALTVMLLDLDGFKEINDSQGHMVGDRVLREVAQAMASAVRAQDTVARQGGDEFSILAPETTNEQAASLATRVQQAVSAAMSGTLTTSIGWATYPAHGEDPGALLTLADTDLRNAKQMRRRGREVAGAEVVPLAGRSATG